MAGDTSCGRGHQLWLGTPAPVASEDGLGVLSLIPLQESGGCWALQAGEASL